MRVGSVIHVWRVSSTGDSACGAFISITKVVVSSHEEDREVDVEEATRDVRQLRTTVATRGTDERDSDGLWAACMLGVDGI